RLIERFFFFQAEDGIRDRNVTGVQTCALPISSIEGLRPMLDPMAHKVTAALAETRGTTLPLDVAGTPNEMLELLMDKMVPLLLRSEERRVGKEGSSRWIRPGRNENVVCTMHDR